MNRSFVDSRQGVEQAINLIESWAGNDGVCFPSRRPVGAWLDDDVTVRAEFARLQNSPQAGALAAQARIVWELAVQQRQSTVWFLRNYRPITMLFFQMCEVGAIPGERLLAGNFVDRDFPILTGHAGKLAVAPLKFFDARSPGAFLNLLTTLIEKGAPCRAVCDWALEGKELAAARYASREVSVSFSCLG